MIEKILRVVMWLPIVFLGAALTVTLIPEFVKWVKSKMGREAIHSAAP